MTLYRLDGWDRRARAGVEYGLVHGELQLVEWVSAAMRTALGADAASLPGYPSLDEALARRYGGGAAF
jgi:hypothetical protein